MGGDQSQRALLSALVRLFIEACTFKKNMLIILEVLVREGTLTAGERRVAEDCWKGGLVEMNLD